MIPFLVNALGYLRKSNNGVVRKRAPKLCEDFSLNIKNIYNACVIGVM